MIEKAKKTNFKDSSAALSNYKSAPPPAVFTKQEELDAYRDMTMIRRFSEKAGQLYGQGAIGGFLHLYIGQEAVAVGVKYASKEGDQFITTYRDHAHALVTGCSPRSVMAEMTGREGGLVGGKGGSMHMFSKEHHLYGGHGIIGAQVPLGTGLAFADHYRGNDNVSLVFMGDGASNQGQVYESFNMAALWKLPVVYIIENNRYGMGTAVARASAQTDFSRRGISFNVPGMTVDGMDVCAVASATEEALAYVRSGNGPIILAMETYRYRGHSISDPGKYRSKEEVEEMRRDHDAIDKVKRRVLDKGLATEAEFKAIDKDVRDTVADAVDFALTDSEPAAAELYTDILA